MTRKLLVFKLSYSFRKLYGSHCGHFTKYIISTDSCGQKTNWKFLYTVKQDDGTQSENYDTEWIIGTF